MIHIINRKKILFCVICLFHIVFSINTFGQSNDRSLLAKKFFEEGKVLAERETVKDTEAALEKFKSARKVFSEIGDKENEGKSAFEIGLMFQKLGKRDEALDNYKFALKLFQTTSNRLFQASTINYIGVIYSSLGERKLALDLYNTALRIFYEIDAFEEAIPTINNIGSVYRKLGDTENALFYFNLALPFVKETGDKGSEAMILLNIGDVYEENKEFEKALEFYNRSLPLHRISQNTEGLVWAFNKIGVVKFKLNKFEEAIDFYNQSLTINASRFTDSEALSFHYLMFACKSFGKNEFAAFYGKNAVNKYQILRKGIEKLDEQTQIRYLKTIESTYRQLADLLIELGLFSQAEQVLSLLKEEEYFDFVRRDADEIKNLSKRIDLNENELKLLERYSLLAQKITEIGQKFQKLDDKKRELSRTNAALSPQEVKIYDELSANLNDANAAFKLFLEKELSAEIGKRKAKEIEIDRNLQAKLRKWGNGTVALYTVVSENRYRVILTTPTVQVDGKTDISSSELNKKIYEFREALQNIEIDPRPIGKELYDILIKPIEKDLNAAGAKTLVWSLDGTLRYIPISALSPDGKTYLVEKYQTALITPKTRDDISDSDSQWTALGVGVSESFSVANPDKPNGKINFSPLPGTKNELLKIVRDENDPNEKGILEGKRFLDKDFNLQSFSDLLASETPEGKRKFTVVHIASHFRLGNNWTNSFLLLGDGNILSLEQINNSPQITFGDVELVTLSACNTAFADDLNGKEIDSLAEAIQTKSGKSVLATLWAVIDESTPLLMTEFYRIRKENPDLTKSEAMQIAQTKMISGKLKPDADYINKLAELFERNEENNKTLNFKFDKTKPFAHPFFWSPFVLIGNWR